MLTTTAALFILLLAMTRHVWWWHLVRITARMNRVDVTSICSLVQTILALHLEVFGFEASAVLDKIVLRVHSTDFDRLVVRRLQLTEGHQNLPVKLRHDELFMMLLQVI